MISVIIDIMIVIGAFISMEGVAWFSHKYIMHGLLWSLHRDHHKKESAGFSSGTIFSS
jgi:beta-carotene 3-hydroxylase